MTERFLSPVLIGWVLVLGAAGLEVVWPLMLTESDGGARPAWAAGGMLLAMTSICVFTVALRSLPLGTAYAVWAGVGTAGVAVAGVLVFGDSMDLLRAACLALIVGGVIGLAVTDRPAPGTAR